MKFSIAAFVATVLAVMISGVVSILDGTFTNQRVTMGFLNHGGMWGDLLIMSVAVGFVAPGIKTSRTCFLASLLSALAITVFAHAQWARLFLKDGVTGHMFPTHMTGVWYLDMSGPGWMHVAVMAGLLTSMIMYASSPVTPQVVLIVSILVTVHVCLATLQPGWYCTGTLWSWRHFGPLFVFVSLIWSIAALKLLLARGSL